MKGEAGKVKQLQVGGGVFGTFLLYDFCASSEGEEKGGIEFALIFSENFG